MVKVKLLVANRGMTLIELLVVVAISIILATFSAANVRDMLEKRAIERTASAVSSSINFAQSLAIKTADQVVLCSAVSGNTCEALNWSNGWVIAIPDRNTSNSDLIVIKEIAAPKYGAKIIIPKASILINSSGLIAPGDFQNIVVCNPTLNNFWVSLNLEFSQVIRKNEFGTSNTTLCS